MGKKIAKPIFLDGPEKQNEFTIVVDDYKEQLRELFFVQNPTLTFQPEKAPKKLPDPGGRWVYYPWLNTIVHILPEQEFFLVRTARNRNLITAEEQEKFYNSTIGIGGLSIGNSVALAIVLQGGGQRIKLADFDRLSLTNTNRVRAGVQNLGLLKIEITARQIYEMNPYAVVECFPDGLTPENLDKFFSGLDVMIDELDNIAIKYLVREKAKQYRIPVVMAADNGDNAVVDIERYDLDPNLAFFHGRLGNITHEELAKLDKFGIGKTITKHIGPENVTERMQDSLLDIGKTIVSWPQLGGAALINGAAVAYCVRKIVCGQELESNRALISPDAVLIPDFNTPASITKRKKISANFKKIFGL
ncbi:MAG: ThiF family adenylyltransferase [Patescibacteria group bacterium]